MAVKNSLNQATLLDGTTIKADEKGNFPPLRDIVDVYHACEICPIRSLCDDNNEFDCQIYGMFDGFYDGVHHDLKDAFEAVR